MLARFFVIVCVLHASISQAEVVNGSAYSPEELIDKCLSSEPSDTHIYAQELASRNEMKIVPEVRFKGMRCLSNFFGERFFFEPQAGAFVTQAQEQALLKERADRRAAIEELAAASVEREKKRRFEYFKRLKSSCYDMLSEDEFTALTQPLCAEIFKEFGFPD